MTKSEALTVKVGDIIYGAQRNPLSPNPHKAYKVKSIGKPLAPSVPIGFNLEGIPPFCAGDFWHYYWFELKIAQHKRRCIKITPNPEED